MRSSLNLWATLHTMTHWEYPSITICRIHKTYLLSKTPWETIIMSNRPFSAKRAATILPLRESRQFRRNVVEDYLATQGLHWLVNFIIPCCNVHSSTFPIVQNCESSSIMITSSHRWDCTPPRVQTTVCTMAVCSLGMTEWEHDSDAEIQKPGIFPASFWLPCPAWPALLRICPSLQLCFKLHYHSKACRLAGLEQSSLSTSDKGNSTWRVRQGFSAFMDTIS